MLGDEGWNVCTTARLVPAATVESSVPSSNTLYDVIGPALSIEASQLSRSVPLTKRPEKPSGRDGGTVSGRSAKKPGTVVWMSTPPSAVELYWLFGSGVQVTPSVENA